MVLTLGPEVEPSTVRLDGDLQRGDGEIGSSDEAPPSIEDAELADDSRNTGESALDPNLESRLCGRGALLRRVEKTQQHPRAALAGTMQALGGLAHPRQAVSVPPSGLERHRDSCLGIHGAQIAKRASDACTTNPVDHREVERMLTTHRSAVVDRILDVVTTPARQQQFHGSRRVAIESVQCRSGPKRGDCDSTTGLSRDI